jgi:hypothetical protein
LVINISKIWKLYGAALYRVSLIDVSTLPNGAVIDPRRHIHPTELDDGNFFLFYDLTAHFSDTSDSIFVGLLKKNLKTLETSLASRDRIPAS